MSIVLLAALTVGQFGGIAPTQGIRDVDGTLHYAIMSRGTPIPGQLHTNPFAPLGSGVPVWDGRSAQIIGYVGSASMSPILGLNAMNPRPRSPNALVHRGSIKFLGVGVIH